MKRVALVFCLFLLTLGACTPSAPLTPLETATRSASPTASTTSTPAQTATPTNTSTSTITATQPPPSETLTAFFVPVFIAPSATTKPKGIKTPEDEPPPPAPTVVTIPTSTVIPEITDTPTPTLFLTCDHETAFAFLSLSTENLKVGDSVTVTVTLKNEGCVNLGLPQYRLRIQPDGLGPVFSPEIPDPVVHYLSVKPGESDSQEFVLTAVASGGVTLNGSASFEVHLGYPGPAYWGYAGTAPLSLTVAP